MTKKILTLITICLFIVNLQAQEPGNSLNFDGIYDNVHFADNDGMTALTMETWIYYEDNAATYVVCSKGTHQLEFNILPNGCLYFIPTSGVILYAPNVLAVNQWTHIAGVYDPSQSLAKIYVNGNEVPFVKQGALPLSTPIDNYPTNFVIGSRYDNTYHFKGNIDEFRIWNVARSAQEIADNYALPIINITFQTRLVSYYKFNQGVACGNNTSITSLTDETGNFNGTFYNIALTGTSSNFVESYAMVVPIPQAATNLTLTSFTANWTQPSVGISEKYFLDVSELSDFSTFVFHNVDCGTALSYEVTPVSLSTKNYYYRVRADKASVTGQGGFYKNSIKVTREQTINFNAIGDKPIGETFTLSATASSYLPVTFTSDNPSVATVSGNTVTTVGSGVANIIASQAGDEIYFPAPDVTQKLSVNQTPPGNALNYKMANYNNVALPDYVISPFGGGTEITIEFWYKGSNVSGAFAFYHFHHANNVEYYIILYYNRYCISTDGEIADGISVGNLAIVNDGKWHHLAMTWKANTENGFCSYLDGNLVDSRNSANTTLPTIESGSFLGGWYESGTLMAGELDEVRIWSRALPQATIRANMYSEIRPNEDIVAYYRFNQGAACGNNTTTTYLRDISDHHFHGTLKNFALTNGCTSNWVESYAMVVPVPQAATNITATSFTAKWTAPAVGTVTNYFLDVSEKSDFSTFVLQNVDCGNALSYEVTSVLPNTMPYYYRVRAEKAGLAGGGPFHFNIIKVANKTEQTITVFDAIPDKAVGDIFTVSATASSGLPVTFASDNPSVATVSGNTVTVVGVGVANIIASQAGDEYYYPKDLSQTLSVNLTPPGNALNFNGTNNYVSIPNSVTAPLSGGTEITIEYWFKGSNLQSPVRFQDGGNYIIAGWGATNPQHIISTDGGIIGISIGNEAIIENGKWHHLAMTWKANTENGFCAYLDGILVASRNSENVTLPTISRSNFLGTVAGGSEWLNGTLDEVRIWSVAQSQEIIRANMYSEISAQTDLVAYYRFNQGASCGNNTTTTTLYDFSGNNYNGTLGGFALTNGCTSNWVESYAMVVPTANAANNITTTSFTANWTQPSIGITEKYLLDVSTESDFSSFVGSYQNYDCGTNLFANIEGLAAGTTYYFRVRSEKASVTQQGGNSNTISETTLSVYTISASVNPENTGNISGLGTGIFEQGQTVTLIAIPSTGYHFANWTENGNQVSTETTYMFTVNTDRNLVANFAINTFIITYTAGENGTISGEASQTVNINTNGSEVTAVPNTGYNFVNWSDGSTQNPRTDLNVVGNISVTANFENITSIENFENQKAINIYPNPTNGKINFDFAKNNIQKIMISDITGKQIIEKTVIQQNEQIDLSGFESGIYIISIQTYNKVLITKLIKE